MTTARGEGRDSTWCQQLRSRGVPQMLGRGELGGWRGELGGWQGSLACWRSCGSPTPVPRLQAPLGSDNKLHIAPGAE